MPLYMLQAAYTSEGLKTLADKPENPGEIVTTQLEKLGGRLIGYYQRSGKYDAVAICEMPDDATAGALAISARARGFVKDVKAIKLRGSLQNQFLRLSR